MNRYVFLITIVLLVSASFVFGEQAPQRIYTVSSVNEPPVIDGRLDDVCWKALPETDDFTCITTRSGLAEAQTYVKIGQIAKELIIAFRCVEPNMNSVLRELKVRNDFRESVEIFIDAGLTCNTYRQFRVSVGGLRSVSTGYDNAYEGDITGWQVAVGFEKDSWTVEMAIPYSLIGDVPVLGEHWGFNLNRVRSVAALAELSCWSKTDSHFHQPDKFGQIIFGSFDNWMATYIKSLKSLDEELRTMIKTYPESLANGDELIKRLPPTGREIRIETVTESDKLKAMEQMFAIQEKYQKVLKDARLMVINGEFR